MKRSATTLLAVLFALSPVLHAQEGEQDMPAYLVLMKPGPEHELLKQLVGTWDMTLKMWMTPGQEPVAAEGVSEHSMMLGDRFLTLESKSGEGDMYTEAMNIMGYDRRHKKFTTVGFDTWGTYYVTASGDYDAEKRQWTLYGEDDDPVMGFTQKYNYVLTMLDDDTMKMEIIMLDFPMVEEKEYKMIEILYKRRES